jgi:mRNA-degrading endonuclease toxin of MazEF toxin-antitoxin module
MLYAIRCNANVGGAIPQFADTIERVLSVLQAAGVVVAALAITWAGYKILFQHARWADIAMLVIGGVFIGAAPSLAVMLLYGGSSGETAVVATAPAHKPIVATVLERGDIVQFSAGQPGACDSSDAGRALVMSSALFNRRGRALLVPIRSVSSDGLDRGFSVRLADTDTPDVADVDSMCTADWHARGSQIIGRASARGVAVVASCMQALSQGMYSCSGKR